MPTVQVKVPPPTLETVTFCEGGLLQPAVNVSVVGLTSITGGWVTTKLTATWGLPQLELKVSVVWYCPGCEVSAVTVIVCCFPGSMVPVVASSLNQLAPPVSAVHVTG